ncbi:MAG TPA: helix-turn-helix transcriptional regulator [Candidatus Limnocylindrales bacterium]
MTEATFLVLAALAERPQHGYAVLEDVKRISDGEVKLHVGSLYAVLERLARDGLIEVDREEIVQSRLRRYYRLSGLGVAALRDQTARLKRHAGVAETRLGLGAA